MLREETKGSIFRGLFRSGRLTDLLVWSWSGSSKVFGYGHGIASGAAYVSGGTQMLLPEHFCLLGGVVAEPLSNVVTTDTVVITPVVSEHWLLIFLGWHTTQ